jgi:hypothetical protein
LQVAELALANVQALPQPPQLDVELSDVSHPSLALLLLQSR